MYTDLTFKLNSVYHPLFVRSNRTSSLASVKQSWHLWIWCIV